MSALLESLDDAVAVSRQSSEWSLLDDEQEADSRIQTSTGAVPSPSPSPTDNAGTTELRTEDAASEEVVAADAAVGADQVHEGSHHAQCGTADPPAYINLSSDDLDSDWERLATMICQSRQRTASPGAFDGTDPDVGESSVPAALLAASNMNATQWSQSVRLDCSQPPSAISVSDDNDEAAYLHRLQVDLEEASAVRSVSRAMDILSQLRAVRQKEMDAALAAWLFQQDMEPEWQRPNCSVRRTCDCLGGPCGYHRTSCRLSQPEHTPPFNFFSWLFGV